MVRARGCKIIFKKFIKKSFWTKRGLPPSGHAHRNDRKKLIKICNFCRKIQLLRQYFWNLISLLSDDSYGPRSSLPVKRSKCSWSCFLQMQILGSWVPAPLKPICKDSSISLDCLNRCTIYYLQLETGEYYLFNNELSNRWEKSFS